MCYCSVELQNRFVAASVDFGIRKATGSSSSSPIYLGKLMNCFVPYGDKRIGLFMLILCIMLLNGKL